MDRDARLILEKQRLVIEVNRLFPFEHQRTSIAHEIGHIILNECSGITRFTPCRGRAEEEALCDLIAENLLVPPWELQMFLKASARAADWQSSLQCSSLLKAAAHFQVPVDVIARRILKDLRWLPRRVAIVWRLCRDSKSRSSRRALRISSACHSLPLSLVIPPSVIAPPASVITKAFERAGTFLGKEILHLGRLHGKFAIEAMTFKSPGSGSPGVLSMLAPA